MNKKLVDESVFEDAKKLKKNKNDVATMTDQEDKQMYYVLTKEQFELITEDLK